ncbi:MAG: hypothetical protein J6A19_14165 [Oscillospiraceae bacterium]|nr:hypothetical protein [Oscillospiraceae bacterium]
MFWAELFVTAFLVAGIILAFRLDKKAFREFFYDVRTDTKKQIRKMRSNKHISMKKQVEMLEGRSRSNFLVRSFNEASSILKETHQEQRIKGIYILSVICGAFGLTLSVIFGNPFLTPPMTIGAALVPVWIVKLSASQNMKRLNDELEVALSGVTMSYIRSSNIIQAVEENLPYMNGSVKYAFTRFVNESRLINSNVSLGIQKLRMAIDNDTFHEWCDAVYQCQSDTALNVTLFPIVNKFSETKSIQAELDTLMMVPFKDTISVVVLVVLSIPLMYLISPDWYALLTDTVGGKLILSGVAVVIIFAINKSITLTKPIKHGEK